MSTQNEFRQQPMNLTVADYNELMQKVNAIGSDLKHVLEKQVETSSDTKEINHLLKNPDTGIIVRLSKVEDWKNNWMSRQSRLLWLMAGSTATIIGAILISKLT